ncbi:MAG: 3-hydroxyacyl-CoA dehydrogenase family protein [Ginsengibacter sp.]
MRLGLMAEDPQKLWITTKFYTPSIVIQPIDDFGNYELINSCDALFILNENVITEQRFINFAGPVFFNEVVKTVIDLHLPKNYHRFNGWSSFLEREKLEVVSKDSETVTQFLAQLNWSPVFSPDIPGFISARVVAMIINEAWFALGENISSKPEIDLALKLGTNYPHGPFEWGAIIGLQRVYNLLKSLSATSDRYLVAPALEQAITQIN